MKYSIFIVFLSIGISHGLFGSWGQIVGNLTNSITDQLAQTAENVWNDVTRHVEKVIGDLMKAPEGINYAANIFWDSLFSRTFDVMIKGKIDLQLTTNDTMRFFR